MFAIHVPDSLSHRLRRDCNCRYRIHPQAQSSLAGSEQDMEVGRRHLKDRNSVTKTLYQNIHGHSRVEAQVQDKDIKSDMERRVRFLFAPL